MPTTVELLVLPYDAAQGNSIVSRLIDELTSGTWTRFRVAVAFARISGNAKELTEALTFFVDSGGTVSLTFGADQFGTDAGTDLQAVEHLLDVFLPYDNAVIFLYHEGGRTFHPKVYLFDNISTSKALLILGSSNWSRQGGGDNVEANVILGLDLKDPEDAKVYGKIAGCFDVYWTEQ